jgi:hypothetical protein
MCTSGSYSLPTNSLSTNSLEDHLFAVPFTRSPNPSFGAGPSPSPGTSTSIPNSPALVADFNLGVPFSPSTWCLLPETPSLSPFTPSLLPLTPVEEKQHPHTPVAPVTLEEDLVWCKQKYVYSNRPRVIEHEWMAILAEHLLGTYSTQSVFVHVKSHSFIRML